MIDNRCYIIYADADEEIDEDCNDVLDDVADDMADDFVTEPETTNLDE